MRTVPTFLGLVLGHQHAAQREPLFCCLWRPCSLQSTAIHCEKEEEERGEEEEGRRKRGDGEERREGAGGLSESQRACAICPRSRRLRRGSLPHFKFTVVRGRIWEPSSTSLETRTAKNGGQPKRQKTARAQGREGGSHGGNRGDCE